jgi:AmiR/NasT family two-component response regulator
VTASSIIQNLRNTRIAVIHPRDRDGEELIRHLQRIGCQVQGVWPPPQQLPQAMDAVFFFLDREQQTAMPWRTAEGGPALIAILDYENPTLLKALLDSNAHAVLIRPIRPVGVLSNLVMALSMRGYESRLTAKVAKLEETLRTRRDIEKATRLIMGLKNISESDAYQFIRKQATAKRVSIGVIAVSIIRATEVLEGLRLDPERDPAAD